MFIIRSYQTTVVTGAIGAALHPLMDGPNNSVHTGLVIPANTLALGDRIDFTSFFRIDIASDLLGQSWSNEIAMDGMGFAGVSGTPVFTAGQSPGAWVQRGSLQLGNDGFIYQMFLFEDTSNSTNELFSGTPGAGLDLVAVPGLLDVTALTAFSGGFARQAAPFDRSIPHFFTCSVGYDSDQDDASFTLISAGLEIHQPSNGNTAGR